MEDKILSILLETRPESDFASSSDFIGDGLLDSFDMIILIRELEAQFGVKIEGIDVVPQNFCSLKAIARLLSSPA